MQVCNYMLLNGAAIFIYILRSRFPHNTWLFNTLNVANWRNRIVGPTYWACFWFRACETCMLAQLFQSPSGKRWNRSGLSSCCLWFSVYLVIFRSPIFLRRVFKMHSRSLVSAWGSYLGNKKYLNSNHVCRVPFNAGASLLPLGNWKNKTQVSRNIPILFLQ